MASPRSPVQRQSRASQAYSSRTRGLPRRTGERLVVDRSRFTKRNRETSDEFSDGARRSARPRRVDDPGRAAVLPDPRRPRRRRDQGRAPAHRRQHARPRPEQGRRPAVVDGDQPQQADRRARPQVAVGCRGAAPPGRPPPTSWSRTSGPAPSRRGGSAPTSCMRANPGLVVARITGWGQTGPYAGRAGFGTLAEAMSGFADGHRRGRRAAHAAGVRPGRQHLRHRRVVGDPDGAAPPRRHRRGPGLRPEHPRADHDRGRAGADDLPAARHRRAAPRQPLDQQRAAQHLPHRRRQVGRHLHLAPSASPSG